MGTDAIIATIISVVVVTIIVLLITNRFRVPFSAEAWCNGLVKSTLTRHPGSSVIYKRIEPNCVSYTIANIPNWDYDTANSCLLSLDKFFFTTSHLEAKNSIIIRDYLRGKIWQSTIMQYPENNCLGINLVTV